MAFNYKRADFWLPNFGFKRSLLSLIKTKELLMHHCGCHGKLVTIAMRYVADAYRPKECPYQI